jgi:hypothetical protein
LRAGAAGLCAACAVVVAVLSLRGSGAKPAPAEPQTPAQMAAASADAGELLALKVENARLRQANRELGTAVVEVQATAEKYAADRKSPPAAGTPRAGGTAAKAANPADPEKWIVLFRADDPSAWDSPSYTAERFAVPLHLVPDFRYLRLRRMDTEEALILQMTRAHLRNDKPLYPETGYWWSGTASLAYGGRHLGIVQGPRYKFPGPHGMICPMFDGWDGFSGSGFGHKYGVGDVQYYCWRGQEIPRTVFEIAVTSGPLTPEEELFVVGRP